MKKLYWRPQRVSVRVLALLAVVAAAGHLLVEAARIDQRQPYYAAKLRAAQLARRAFEAIREERLRRGIEIDAEADPAQSGLIGVLLSETTTNRGHLPAKQTSINPNFAALVVHLLERAGVQRGDRVAVGVSGSFPAINISTYAALATIGARPIIISSAGASQFGANHPDFMWPDMEHVLRERHVFEFQSGLVSRGGIEDRALGLSKASRAALDAVVRRNALPLMTVKSYHDSVDRRWTHYQAVAGGEPIKAYINVGGGTSSVGTAVGKHAFKPGLNKNVPRGVSDIDAIITRFAREGVPVIHLIRIDTLATRYGLPLAPTRMPPVGEGKIFVRDVHNRWLAGGVLALLAALLVAFVRLDWGYRLMATTRHDGGDARPEQMV